MRTACTASSGARNPRCFLASERVNSSKTPGSSSTGCSSPVRRSGRCSARMRSAKATAPFSRSPSMISSTRPSLSASAAPRSLPSAIMVSAARAGIRRGRRCVPAAPGMMPSLTSGSPRRVSRTATRKWHDRASSSPPPSAVPCSAAITGLALASVRATTSPELRILERLAELAHVGAGAEGAAAAHDHQRRERRIGRGALECIDKARAHAVRQCIDRRVVDRGDGNAATRKERDWLRHGAWYFPVGSYGSSRTTLPLARRFMTVSSAWA